MRSEHLAERPEHVPGGFGLGTTTPLDPAPTSGVIPIAHISDVGGTLADDRDSSVFTQPQRLHATTPVGSDATQSRTSWGRYRSRFPTRRPGGPEPALRHE